MKVLEKARLALRKYILENKEKVLNDLAEMRSKSENNLNIPNENKNSNNKKA